MKHILTAALVLTLLTAGTVAAGQFYGGKGYLHTNSALVLPPGALDLSYYARAYTAPVKSGGTSYFISNGTNAIATSFGFSRRVEIGFTQILYQMLNSTRDETGGSAGKPSMVPGNTYIRIKAAGYPIGDNMFWGFMGALRYRVGNFQDIHLEPFESVAIEPEATVLLSYYTKPLYPEEAPSYHLNLGYLNHNDAASPTDAAQEMNFLVSALFPRPRFDYGVELYGSAFMKQPGVSTLGRENWMYLCPMVRYKLFKGLSFTVGLDLLMMGGTDTSIPTTDPLPNYPGYRISGRINFTPSTAFYAAPTFVKANATTTGRERRTYAASGDQGGNYGGGGGGGPQFNRQELFRWGIEERGGDIQSVDLDLEKLRQDRKAAEEELKALKLKLEERQKSGQQ